MAKHDKLAKELHEGHPSDAGASKRYRKFAKLSVAERKVANAKMHSMAKKSSADHINAERKRQGYKPMDAKRKRIHEGMDKYL